MLVAGVPCAREPSEGGERRAPSSGRRQRLSIAALHSAPRPPSPTSSLAPPEAAVIGGVGEVLDGLLRQNAVSGGDSTGSFDRALSVVVRSCVSGR